MELNEKIIQAIEEKKGFDVVKIDLSELNAFTDTFIICSGASTVQTIAIFRHIHKELKKEYKVRGIEGENYGQWILLDYNNTLVHIFTEEIRKKYDLELLWADGKFTEYNRDE